MKLGYTTSCVSLVGRRDIDELGRMKESATKVTLKTFRRRVDSKRWEESMGYARHGRGLALSKEWHVRYFKSTWHGRPCYFAIHSAIEWIFAQANQEAGS